MNPDTGNVYELAEGQEVPSGHIGLPHPPVAACVTCRGKGSAPGPGADHWVPCPVCYRDHSTLAHPAPGDLRARMMPAPPNANCKEPGCYGRGHVGLNRTTNKFRPCPKCYPGAAESELTPHEIIAATEAALENPEQLGRLMEALEKVEEDGGEAADKVLQETPYEEIEERAK